MCGHVRDPAPYSITAIKHHCCSTSLYSYVLGSVIENHVLKCGFIEQLLLGGRIKLRKGNPPTGVVYKMDEFSSFEMMRL